MELRVPDSMLECALPASELAAAAPQLAAPPARPMPPLPPPAKRLRAEPVPGLRDVDAFTGAQDAPRASTALCSECGRHAGRGGLLTCMGCDAAFHRKCADWDDRPAHGDAVCLCPPCWDAQH